MIDTGKTLSVLGRAYPVQMREEGGLNELVFYIDLGGGQELEDASWFGLSMKAAEFRDVRFSLPFTTRYGTDGTVTGFHAGNGSMLIRWRNGKASQENERDLRYAMPRLDEADRAELAELTEAAKAANSALDLFLTGHQFEGGIRKHAQQAREKEAGLA